MTLRATSSPAPAGGGGSGRGADASTWVNSPSRLPCARRPSPRAGEVDLPYGQCRWLLPPTVPTLETGQELENNNSMSLKEKLASDRFVITAEIAPPVSCDAADLMAKAAPLKGLADAVNVTDGAGARAHLGAVAAAAILLREGIEPILQFTCRDRNRIALQ